MKVPADAGEVLEVLHRVTTDVRQALGGLDNWGLSGEREGQYRSDLVADRAALLVLDEAGYGVLSEESGPRNTERPVLVVIDPVDGSTNASRGLPWWATSTCALDADGPLAAVVANQALDVRYEATRGGGARYQGQPVHPGVARVLGEAIVAFSGYPSQYLGWAQYRSLGAAALDLCAVASGGLDGFMDCAPRSLAPWDYLGGMLICQEAGASIAEGDGRQLVTTDPDARRAPVAAGTPELLRELLDGRAALHGPRQR